MRERPLSTGFQILRSITGYLLWCLAVFLCAVLLWRTYHRLRAKRNRLLFLIVCVALAPLLGLVVLAVHPPAGSQWLVGLGGTWEVYFRQLLVALVPSLMHLCVAAIVGWWLFRIWHRTREAAYIWLAAGLGLMPCVDISVVQFDKWGIFLLGPESFGNISLYMTLDFIRLMLLSLRLGCIVLGLSHLAGGIVPPNSLFRWNTQREASLR